MPYADYTLCECTLRIGSGATGFCKEEWEKWTDPEVLRLLFKKNGCFIVCTLATRIF